MYGTPKYCVYTSIVKICIMCFIQTHENLFIKFCSYYEIHVAINQTHVNDIGIVNLLYD